MSIPSSTIPPIIHQVWFQFSPDKPSTPPAEYDEMRASWRNFHPGWEVKLWNEEQALQLLHQHYPWAVENFQAYEKPILKVDAIRYFLLHHFGGFYVDCDTLCKASLEPLRKEKTVLVRDVNPALGLNNGFMGSVQGDVLMFRCARNLPKSSMFSDPIQRTGPQYLTFNWLTANNKSSIKILTVKQLQHYFEHYHFASWTWIAQWRKALDPKRRQYMKLEEVPSPLRFFLKGRVGKAL